MPTLFTSAFVRFLNGKAFDESAHPRGQPENAGQFAPSEGAREAVEKAKESTAEPKQKIGGSMTRDQVADLLAEQHHNKLQGRTPEQMAEKWIASDNFVRMEIPIDAVSPATAVPEGAASRSTGPIIVDANRTGMGRTEGGYGAPAPVLILDGKHRHAQAKREGRKTITAMVGEKAVPHIERAIGEHREQSAKVSAAVSEYVGTQDGTTLRHLKATLPPAEVERIRVAVRAAKNGEAVPPEILADYPAIAEKYGKKSLILKRR